MAGARWAVLQSQLTCPDPVAEPVRRGGERGCEQVDTVPLSAFLEPAPEELETDTSAEAEVGSRRSRMSTASTAAMFAAVLARPSARS